MGWDSPWQFWIIGQLYVTVEVQVCDKSRKRKNTSNFDSSSSWFDPVLQAQENEAGRLIDIMLRHKKLRVFPRKPLPQVSGLNSHTEIRLFAGSAQRRATEVGPQKELASSDLCTVCSVLPVL